MRNDRQYLGRKDQGTRGHARQNSRSDPPLQARSGGGCGVRESRPLKERTPRESLPFDHPLHQVTPIWPLLLPDQDCWLLG